MMHHPTIRHINQSIAGASTGIIDTNIPDQMRLTMLDVTPDGIQAICQLNDDHLRDQWGKTQTTEFVIVPN
jgi:phage host-nuclease inhibitor protein Gam